MGGTKKPQLHLASPVTTLRTPSTAAMLAMPLDYHAPQCYYFPMKHSSHGAATVLQDEDAELLELEGDLKAIDDELVVLHRKQEQYFKLEDVCNGLKDLEEMGAGHLFWDKDSEGQLQARLEHAQWEIGKYHESIVEVESRKEKVLEDIEEQNVKLDYLHYDLQDIIEQEEALENEWLVERELDAVVGQVDRAHAGAPRNSMMRPAISAGVSAMPPKGLRATMPMLFASATSSM